MRSLVVLEDGHLDLRRRGTAHVEESAQFVVDDEAGRLYRCTTSSEDGCSSVHCHSAQSGELLWEVGIDEWAAGAVPDLAGPASVAAFLLAVELDALFIALASGHLLLLDTSPASAAASRLEEVGCVAGGVRGAAWSPDGAALALVSGAGQLLLMTQDWEVLGELPLRAAAAGASPADSGGDAGPLPPGAVAISWRGDGRFFATCSQDSPGAGRTVRIWDRELCELHAVGEAAPALHGVLAWQPNGRHLYAAQALPSAEAAAADQQQPEARVESERRGGEAVEARVEHVGAWKRELRRQRAAEAEAHRAGSGAGHRVVLYERNGLQHGGFGLPSLGGEVAALAWSPDSEFLAVVLAGQSSSGGAPATLLQLWQRSNWHWYLKWQRDFAAGQAVSVAWDEASPLRLQALTADGHFLTLAFGQAPAVSHLGTAAVVDGSHVLITPLRHALVPPPMCAVRVVCEAAGDGAAAAVAAPVACLALRSLRGHPEAVAAVLSDGRVAAVESCEDDLWEETAEEQEEDAPQVGGPELCLRAAVLDGYLPGSLAPHQAAWLDERRLLVVGTACGGAASSGCGDQLLELLVDLAAGTASELALSPAPGRVLRCVLHPVAGALLQLEGGEMWQYGCSGTSEPGQLEPAEGSGFPCSCPAVAATPAAALELAPPGGCPLAFGLSASGRLLWGARQLATEVTSFAVRQDGPGGAFLLYTTRAHNLHTVSLAALLTGAGGQKLRPEDDVTARAVEHHALLVAVPPGGVTAVLQMPRGNLEAVAPRALVLPAVTEALDACQFGAAQALAATHRLDLNLLVDYRWPAFLGHAAEFVRQIRKDQDLADIVAALSPESVAAEGGLYYGAIPGSAPAAAAAAAPAPAAGAASGAGKVAAVCAAVRDALLRLQEAGAAGGRGRVCLSKALVTSHAKCGDLEAALAAVQAAKEESLQQDDGGAGPSTSGCSPEDALRHLMLFTPDERLYQAALGMYQLPLAYMVVAHSQRDPGEYQIELQAFAAIGEPELQRHAIDMHLRRFDKALSHLVAAGDSHFQEGLELARKHGLMRQLLKLVEGRPELRSQVHLAYGEVLEARGLCEDAGLAFVAAGASERAVQVYRQAGQWRTALAVAGLAAGSTPPEHAQRVTCPGAAAVSRLAGELADDLAGMARCAEAAVIRLEHLQEVDAAVELLAGGREWREALRVAYGYARPDLVETIVAPAAAASAAAALEDAKEALARVAKYWARLKELRQRRGALAAALAAADEVSGLASRQQQGEGDWDAASDAASAASGLSVYTDNTHTGNTLAGSSTRASTVGGRKPQKQKKNKGTRIREGSPEEEQQLAGHLLSLAPTEGACAEAGQLCELLVLLGHEPDARLLQQRMAALVAATQEVGQDLLAHPPRGMGLELPPGLLLPLLQHAAVAAALAAQPGLDLQQRVAAAAKAAAVSWKWDILREA